MTKPWPHRNWSWRIRMGVTTGALALLLVLGRIAIMTPLVEAHADTTFTLLYSFKNRPDGAGPTRLIRDGAGNFYGTTGGGGAGGYGTVFKLDATGAETVLYSFTGGADGRNPYAGLVRDPAGNLYGTTYYGGSSNNCYQGCGTVFKLDTTGAETVLHSFTGTPDGNWPLARLVRDATGNLYGTTHQGGAFGWGMVFKLDTTGAMTVLYSFAGGADGGEPDAELILDAAGNLYGTTLYGGDLGKGTVFKVDPAGNETVLHRFPGAGGAFPHEGLVRDTAGNLYGTTEGGGHWFAGSVFKLSR